MATKDFSSVQEKKVASALNWSVVAGSGAVACLPGDVVGDNWLGECKTHTSSGKKIFFDYNVWEKIVKEATVKRRYPALFADDGSQDLDKTWCLALVHSGDIPNLSSTPYNLPTRKNISFSGESARRELKKIGAQCYSYTWGKYSVVIMPFSIFETVGKE